MAPAMLRELPYRADSDGVFSGLARRPWAVFLDSGHPYDPQGRYDIIASDPVQVLITRGQKTEIRDPSGLRHSLEDPFALLQEALGAPTPGLEGIPFCGGAIGYFGYDLGRRLERIPSLAQDAESVPEMAVGIYGWALVVDHRAQRSWLVARSPALLEKSRQMLSAMVKPGRVSAPGAQFRVRGTARSNLSHEDYLARIARIKRYIRDGDCYQVNFAQRFSVPAEGDPWHAYLGLRRLNPAPFGAYLSTPDCQVMCSSPERFLQVRCGAVETKPIKGTAPRGRDPIEDLMLADALRGSPKDRAENLMIVDLLRNDLGKVCRIGSVHVPRLFEVESFARVHHLVSTVRGHLADGRKAIDLLRACFPGGSITGAPKVRAMEIIEELEPQRRGVYCGSIGYVGFDGDMDTNIAIRTMVHSKGVIRLWAGGGIVADSDPEAEYRETYHKAAPLLDLLGQMVLENVGS